MVMDIDPAQVVKILCSAPCYVKQKTVPCMFTASHICTEIIDD